MPNITIEIKLMQSAKQCLGMYYTVSGFSQLGQELVKVLQIQWHKYYLHAENDTSSTH